MGIPIKPATSEEIADLARSAQALLAAIRGAKAMGASYEVLRTLGESYVKAHTAWQVARYGKVRQHIRVESLIR